MACRWRGIRGFRRRGRLGCEPLERLHDEWSLAEQGTRGAWYRQWRLVSIDGSTLEVADEPRNEQAFGRPGASRGRSAFPQVRMVSLLEGGTHVLFGTRMGSYARSELALAEEVIGGLEAGMLCLAELLRVRVVAPGAGDGRRPAVESEEEPVSAVRAAPAGRLLSQHRVRAAAPASGGVRVRVVEYRLEGVEESEPLYRLVTSVLDPERAPARELAALYHERWEIETAFDELKTHLRGARMVLRSKTPELVKQEFFGLLLAHYAVRKLMHEAALKADLDADSCRSCTRSAWSVASCRCSSLPPPADRPALYEPFWTRSWTSRWIPVAAAGTRAG